MSEGRPEPWPEPAEHPGPAARRPVGPQQPPGEPDPPDQPRGPQSRWPGLPRHVWYQHDQSMTTPHPPLPGILTDWRQVPDRRGHLRWEGLVTYARGGGVVTEWVAGIMVRPVEVVAPRPGSA